MESNKENYRCPVGKTRIPLPQDPLPPVPKHLTTEHNKKQEADVHRLPLQILDSRLDQNVQSCSKPREPKNLFSQAGPSREKCVINTKYVTMRPKDDQDLDWGLNIFKCNESPGSGDVNPKDNNEKDIFNDAILEEENETSPVNEIILAGSSIRPHTPANKPSALETARVKSLKKSLKRPHSRELQGLSPLSKERKRLKEEKLKRQLSLQNPGRWLSYKLRPPDYITVLLSDCLSQYVPEMFDNLLKSEKKASPTQFVPKATRACVVNWLIKVNGPDGNPAVLQAACWFLDSIFARRAIPVAQLQLKATACFWIALKLYGPAVTSVKLVKVSDDAFSDIQLVAAEKNILNFLGFPPQPVVPQEYISYLSWVCDSQHHAEIEMTATFIAMCSLLFHTNNCSEQPSVVAAAAMQNACICLGRSDLSDKLGKCQVYRKAEAKAVSFKRTCSAQRIAVRTVFSPNFEYKAPLTHYGQPLLCLAQRVLKVANTLSAMDEQNTGLQIFTF